MVTNGQGNWKKIWYDGKERWVFGGSGYASIKVVNPTRSNPSSSSSSSSLTPILSSSTTRGITRALRDMTNPVDSGTSSVLLKKGDHGEKVKDLQKRLASVGYSISADGIFGSQTENALKRFQRAMGVEMTGKFGPTTRKALEEAERLLRSKQKGSGIAYERGRKLGSIRTVYIDGKPVKIETALAYMRMAEAAAQSGINLRLNSGFRTYGKQKALYHAYLSGRGNLAAPPGYSNHQNGLAVDIDIPNNSVYQWLKKNAWRYGFKRTVPNESWHWEYRP
ncbi:MAG: hypothetical protein D6785_16765 [Planctomycetota bacterium]|nr:MAG: hypothetical protein D6785_16765 [Planctomycetota bacterium]